MLVKGPARLDFTSGPPEYLIESLRNCVKIVKQKILSGQNIPEEYDT